MAFKRVNEKTILPTAECYDAWSSTYDSDGNILQLLDDVAFEEIVSPLLKRTNDDPDSKPVSCELGCGTGRNTAKMIKAGWSVIAVDISSGMMAKAQERLTSLSTEGSAAVSWLMHDLNGEEVLSVDPSSVDAVLSTLVLEHITSLDKFFQTVYRILKKNRNSWAWISAMHPNMYQAGSQAGFVIDEQTGDKLCGVSFDHSIGDIIQAATKNHLTLLLCVEKGVENETHAQTLGPRAMKWIGVNIHVSFLFQIATEAL